MDILCGNAVVGQSGGPTAVINATLAGVIRGAIEAKNTGIIDNLFGMRNGIEGLLDRRIALVSSYSMKQDSSGLPPQGGRPKSEDVTSDGNEQDADQGVTPK